MKQLIFIILFFITIAKISAEDVKVETLKITPVEDNIFVSIYLSKYFHPSVSDAIKNGIEAVLTYKIELWKKNAMLFFFDKKVLSIEIQKSVSYNMWDRIYSVKTGKDELKFNSQKEMLDDMIKIENVSFCKKNIFNKEDYYYIRARAELESLKLFPPLSFIFDLTSYWNFKTSWRYTDVFIGKIYNDR